MSLRTGKPVEQVLRELYVERGMTQLQIAAELGISRITVALWLREFGVERPAAATA